MAITIEFKKEYADLICKDIPLREMSSSYSEVPEKYRKKFIHSNNGFVKLFCEEYEKDEVGIHEII